MGGGGKEAMRTHCKKSQLSAWELMCQRHLEIEGLKTLLPVLKHTRPDILDRLQSEGKDLDPRNGTES